MTFYSLKHALNPEKIDAAVDTALAAETLVGTLGTTVGTLETTVGTLETTVGTLETTVGTLETTVDALDKLTVDDDGPVLNEILTQLLALYDPDTHELVLDNGTVKVAAKSP
jgi:hypothetical protein